jgi:endoglucanase
LIQETEIKHQSDILNKHIKNKVTILLLLLAFVPQLYAQEKAYWMRLVDGLEFCDLKTVNGNTLELTFRSEKRSNPYATDPSDKIEDYMVNGKTPAKIGRYSSTIFRYKNMYKNPDTGKWFAVSERYNPEMVMHKIYLVLDSTFNEGSYYHVNFPGGDTLFQFSQHLTICSSIKINQVGYEPNTVLRRAFFNSWSGSLGYLPIECDNLYEVYNARTHELMHSASFKHTFFEDKNDENYLFDLSFVVDTGLFYVSLPGVGRSPVFGIGNRYAYHLYHVHMKGLFHQRCGMALQTPYTQWERERCHHNMYIMDENPSKDKIQVPDSLEAVESIGGYHDAADWDQRSLHMLVPAWLMSAYSYSPEVLSGEDLNLPETGNGIPDLLDEVLWGIKRWELLQTEDGGIRAGMETSGHPQYGEFNAVRDNYKYGTYRVEGYATLMGAGVMANAARLLAPFNKERADSLKIKAEKAWDFYETHRHNSTFVQPDWQVAHEWTPGPLMYAALQLYLLSRKEKYHEHFVKEYRDVMMEDKYSYPIEYQQYYYSGNTLKQGAVLTFHFIDYALEAEIESDTLIFNHIREEVIRKADAYEGQLNKPAYAALYTEPWGMGSGVGRWAEVLLWAYRFTENQKYLDAASSVADFVLGANPQGICMTTGLGSRPPYNPLIDAFDHILKGRGPFPGVVIYNFGGADKNQLDACYPPYDEWPKNRRYIDSWLHVAKSEFTVFETMAPNIFMYAALLDEHEFSGPVLPYGNPEVFPGGHYRNIQSSEVENTWKAQVEPEKLKPIQVKNEEQNTLDGAAIQVFPNPAHSSGFNVYCSQEDISRIEIFSQSGQKLFDKRNIQQNQVSIKKNLPPGVHLLVIHLKYKRYMKKVLVLKN